MCTIETFVTTQSFNDATRDAIYDFPNDFVIRKILYRYLKKNKNCQVGDEKMYYKILIQSIQNYISAELYTSFNRVPPKNELLTLDSIEYRRYKKIMENLPGCYELIKDYLHRPPSDVKPKETVRTAIVSAENDLSALSDTFFPKMFLHNTLRNVPIKPRHNTDKSNIFAKTMRARNKMKQELLYGISLIDPALTTHPIDTNIIEQPDQSNLNAIISAMPKVVRPKLTRNYTPRVISTPGATTSEDKAVPLVRTRDNPTAKPIRPDTQYRMPHAFDEHNSRVPADSAVHDKDRSTPRPVDIYDTRSLKSADTSTDLALTGAFFTRERAKKRSRPLLIKTGIFDIIDGKSFI
tara:strand:- start:11555 stop:12607 length:1053 start_codon:yes stop_codon:yes gene_type:complete